MRNITLVDHVGHNLTVTNTDRDTIITYALHCIDCDKDIHSVQNYVFSAYDEIQMRDGWSRLKNDWSLYSVSEGLRK